MFVIDNVPCLINHYELCYISYSKYYRELCEYWDGGRWLPLGRIDKMESPSTFPDQCHRNSILLAPFSKKLPFSNDRYELLDKDKLQTELD